MNPRVSVIIPTYNEQDWIGQALDSLARASGDFEVIVVDGESTDDTRSRVEALIPACPFPLQVISARKNRGRQLNCGAEVAQGDVLLFLHADALLHPEAIRVVEIVLQNESIVGGNFDLAYQGDDGWSRFITWANRARRAFGIYYGDSGIFVRCAVFRRLGGFKPIPIMDDYDFVRRMERCGRTVCLAPALRVSNRRWRAQGIFRTLLSWCWIQTLYSLGVPPRCLARWYKPVRAGDEITPLTSKESPAARQPSNCTKEVGR